MMNWLKLSENKTAVLSRGSVIKFLASYPFENEVMMMVCGAPLSSRSTFGSFGLITITGSQAGINCFMIFPDSAQINSATISAQWLYDNWQHWVWPDGSPDDVWLLSSGELDVNDLK